MDLPSLSSELLIPATALALWCGGTWLSGIGWRHLARSFPVRSKPGGKKFSWQSGSVGGVGCRNVLTIRTSTEGLHLSAFLPFRVGHPPFFIPWHVIHNAVLDHTIDGVSWETVSFDVGSPSICRLQLPQKVFGDHTVWLPKA